MRVNVYAEELTDRIEYVTKDMGMDPVLGGVKFHAVRLYLGFPFVHREGDDDSSAITFWVPWTKRGGHDFDRLLSIFQSLIRELEMARDEAE